MGRPTVAEIDLAAIRHNFNLLAHKAGGPDRVLGVVKADAYGHGAAAVGKVLEAAGARMLGVATTEEAGELRDAGINKDILILGAILPREIDQALETNLTITVADVDFAHALNEQTRHKRTSARVHINIDTGMGRIGIPWEGAVQAVTKMSKLPGLRIEGIFTHFPTADETDKSFTYEQITRFKEVLDRLEKQGLKPPLVHAASSGALLELPESCFDMSRPGISLYGYYPSPEVRRQLALLPAMTLKTRIGFLKTVPPGISVSYGRTFVTRRESVLATLPVGYADGYFRAFSNRGKMKVKTQLAPVAGRVCMDQTIIDVTGIPNVSIGDEVTVYSACREDPNSVENLASLLGTIPNEVLCAISKRVPRVYRNPEAQT